MLSDNLVQLSVDYPNVDQPNDHLSELPRATLQCLRYTVYAHVSTCLLYRSVRLLVYAQMILAAENASTDIQLMKLDNKNETISLQARRTLPAFIRDLDLSREY
ncbi:hypothetical protein EVAR_89095_1 [Eumeta japonica]|uniref:Uncharacterized protein n=1 Tax=Eumeta variegata TaxID=151549 RepID=A0A4C1XHQ1_EUMVA|nr:hypothetical protein EVAR_89095_1 [Eumeta japonica]